MNTNQIPFDPDFDESPEEIDIVDTVETAESKYSGFSSKQAFVIGLISSLLALGTMGFILLLVKIVAD